MDNQEEGAYNSLSPKSSQPINISFYILYPISINEHSYYIRICLYQPGKLDFTKMDMGWWLLLWVPAIIFCKEINEGKSCFHPIQGFKLPQTLELDKTEVNRRHICLLLLRSASMRVIIWNFRRIIRLKIPRSKQGSRWRQETNSQNLYWLINLNYCQLCFARVSSWCSNCYDWKNNQSVLWVLWQGFHHCCV